MTTDSALGTIDKVLMNSDSSDQFIKRLMTSLVLGTRASNAVPSTDGANDFDYLMGSNPQFKALSKQCKDELVYLVQEIGNFSSSSYAFPTGQSDSVDSNMVLFDHVVEMIDLLLEDVDLKLDDACNAHTAGSSSVVGVGDSSKLRFAVDKDTMMQNRVMNTIPKSQLLFANSIDNTRETPFRPRLTAKPFLLSPLDLMEIPQDASVIGTMPFGPFTHYANPYEREIVEFKCNSTWFDKLDAWLVVGRPSSTCPAQLAEDGSSNGDDDDFEFVSTSAQMDAMIEDLSAPDVRELAIDLEHHAFRSFQGFTCLMQLSTRSQDYIIDTLALRMEMHKLLHIFANPNIVKVLHGCENDSLWLQKDFGLHLVNCFDTYHAAKALKFPSCSLAHLLKYYCNFVVNKKHQLSDWRQRPLPADMLAYARTDTHFLLYIYDCIRFDLFRLLNRDGLLAVCEATKKSTLPAYEKPIFKSNGHLDILADIKKLAHTRRGQLETSELSDIQVHVLAGLYEWRDRLARTLDESIAYVCSNADLIKLAVSIPRNEPQLLALGVQSRGLGLHGEGSGSALRKQVLDTISTQLSSAGIGGGVYQFRALDADEKLEQVSSSSAGGRRAPRVQHGKRRPPSVILFVPQTTDVPVIKMKAGAVHIGAVNLTHKTSIPSNTSRSGNCADVRSSARLATIESAIGKMLAFANVSSEAVQTGPSQDRSSEDAAAVAEQDDSDERSMCVTGLTTESAAVVTTSAAAVTTAPSLRSEFEEGEGAFPPSLAQSYNIQEKSRHVNRQQSKKESSTGSSVTASTAAEVVTTTREDAYDYSSMLPTGAHVTQLLGVTTKSDKPKGRKRSADSLAHNPYFAEGYVAPKKAKSKGSGADAAKTASTTKVDPIVRREFNKTSVFTK